MSRNAGHSVLSSQAPDSKRTSLLSAQNWAAGKAYPAGVIVYDGMNYWLSTQANHSSSLAAPTWLQILTETVLDARYAAIGAVGGASALVPTPVKTSTYVAAVGDNVLVNCTAGSVGVAMPALPADKSQVGVKPVSLTVPNVVNLTTQSTDRFNTPGGVTAINLMTLNEEFVAEYQASTGLWIVIDNDLQRPTLSEMFSYTGAAAISVGQGGWPASTDGFIVAVSMNCGTAPTVTACVGDFDKNGTTIFTTQANRPTIPIGQKTSGFVTDMDVGYFLKGDIISFDIDVPGTSTADVKGQFLYHPAV